MSAVSWLNGSAAFVALALAVAVGARTRQEGAGLDRAAVAEVVTDAGDHATRIRDFRRIVSGSTLSDRLLVELCEPDRVIAYTGYGADHSPLGYQYAGKARMEGSDVEKVLALAPDLFITNSYGKVDKLARLREAGVEVFDLGDARGLASLLLAARTVAALVGHADRGERFARSFARRFARVAVSVPVHERRSALYVGVYGNQLFGGGPGTSYHDVLTAAGLADNAPPGWPSYSAEELLLSDPEVIVTKTGMRTSLCGRSPFEGLRACKDGRVVEIPEDTLDDPGPVMLDTAEAIFAAVYGDDVRP